MENSEDEKFRGYATALQKSALDLRQAVRNENYDAGRTAAGTLSKSCSNCHADFR
jgi:cytochrome c556